jgi:hypothetical protein
MSNYNCENNSDKIKLLNDAVFEDKRNVIILSNKGKIDLNNTI